MLIERSRKSTPSRSREVLKCNSYYLKEIDDKIEVCDKSILNESEQKPYNMIVINLFRIQLKIDSFIPEKRVKISSSN